jgi:hypothetical protein
MTSKELIYLTVLKPHGEVTIFLLLKASLGGMSDPQVTSFSLPALSQTGHLSASGSQEISVLDITDQCSLN